LKQILNDIKFSTLNGIKDWSLSIIVYKIRVGTVRNKLLNSLKMAFSAGIEYWGLSISVNLVHITAALLNKIIDKLHLTFSGCVV